MALATITAILDALDDPAKQIISAASVDGKDVLSIFTQVAQSNTLPQNILQPLADQVALWVEQRTFSQFQYPKVELEPTLTAACNSVTQALSAAEPPAQASLVQSIQPHLHQLFLFAATATPAATDYSEALQELCGLIQVLGVINNIQIAPEHTDASRSEARTAIYPCTVPDCHRVFFTMSHLRGHERAHGPNRPYKCTHCSAAFARNHDLKRHVKGHGTTAFRCAGCSKTFSRRDACKRHQENARRADPPCRTAELEEFDLSSPTQRKGRPALIEDDHLDEGEVPPDVLTRIIATVLALQPLLQRHVAHAVVDPPTQNEHGEQPQESQANGTDAIGGLSAEQAAMVEQAIAQAAAQAMAEAEAMLQGEDYGMDEEYEGEGEEEDAEGEPEFDGEP